MIAQIKLLQLASNNYSFTQDSHFREWFAGVEKLSEAERLVHLFCVFLPQFYRRERPQANKRTNQDQIK